MKKASILDINGALAALKIAGDFDRVTVALAGDDQLIVTGYKKTANIEHKWGRTFTRAELCSTSMALSEAIAGEFRKYAKDASARGEARRGKS
jgi:ribonuclease HI